MQPDFMQTTLGVAPYVLLSGGLISGGMAVFASSDFPSNKRSMYYGLGGLTAFALAFGCLPLQDKLQQSPKDRIMTEIVRQADQNLERIAEIDKGVRAHQPQVQMNYSDTVYSGKAEVEAAASKPNSKVVTSLCLRVKNYRGEKSDATTGLSIGLFDFSAPNYNECCYTTGPDGKFRFNPRVKFGSNGPSL